MNPPPASLPPPRQLTLRELRARFDVPFSYNSATHAISVPRAWQTTHLVKVQVTSKRVAWLHRDAAPVFLQWFARVQAAGLESRIVSVDGGFVPRIRRGAKLPLGPLEAQTVFPWISRHTLGIALDLNAAQNRRGTKGAQLGEVGCVHELVALAYPLGIVWGGAWAGESCDAMHFELGALVPSDRVE